MSVLNIFRSFAGSKERDHVPLRFGLTYGNVRDIVNEIERFRSAVAQANDRSEKLATEAKRLWAALEEADAQHGVEIERLRANDRRYRWLRGDEGAKSTRYPRWKLEYWDGPNGWQPMSGAELDAKVTAVIPEDFK